MSVSKAGTHPPKDADRARYQRILGSGPEQETSVEAAKTYLARTLPKEELRKWLEELA